MNSKLFNRFWSKVNKNGPIGSHRPDLGQCWVWLRGKSAGYGQFNINKKSISAHRVSYEMCVGKIPTELVCDHLCRNRACVNPTHIELKSRKENAIAPGSLIFYNGESERIKTHCPSNHEYSTSNTRIYNGSRYCKECTKIYDRKRSKLRRSKLYEK